MFLDSTTDKANKVLLGTQAAKKKLEDNFSELMRQRNELFLHGSRSSAMNERFVDCLTFSCIMLNNGQAYYKNLAVFTPQDFKSMFGLFTTICIKRLSRLKFELRRTTGK